jgi:hypothetical protein
LVPGGFYSSSPFDRRVPVSIRCNNPGAVNGAAWERSYPGYVDTVETTPGNKTTIFEAPEYGVAVWWELLHRYAAAGADTIGGIINRYGGGQDYSAYIAFVTDKTGFTARKKVGLDDDAVLLRFGKAMFHYEAGRGSPLHDEQILYGFQFARSRRARTAVAPPPVLLAPDIAVITPAAAPAPEIPQRARAASDLTLTTREGVFALQSVLIDCGLLDPPADGGYGPVTKWALREFASSRELRVGDEIEQEMQAALQAAEPLPLTPGNDLAGKIVRAMQKNGYWIARHPKCMNIVYVEGMNPDGSINDNRNNVFNDLRIVFKVTSDGVPAIVDVWEATTEPSRRWTLHPMNSGGAFHIKFGQYKTWIRGFHHTHEALVQVGEIEGYRDPNKTFKRDYNHPVRGSDFGVNQHWGYDLRTMTWEIRVPAASLAAPRLDIANSCLLCWRTPAIKRTKLTVS